MALDEHAHQGTGTDIHVQARARQMDGIILECTVVKSQVIPKLKSVAEFPARFDSQMAIRERLWLAKLVKLVIHHRQQIPCLSVGLAIGIVRHPLAEQPNGC